MSAGKVFLSVTGGALVGMVLGGLFGFGASRITPDFFSKVIPWENIEPVGVAIFFGATAGVLLGGALACFAIFVQTVFHWRKTRDAQARG